MHLSPAVYGERHPIAHSDVMPSREQTIALFTSALRVALVAVLFHLCLSAPAWAPLQSLPLQQTLRDNSAEISGIAAGWVAFEFLLFAARARRAAQPPPL